MSRPTPFRPYATQTKLSRPVTPIRGAWAGVALCLCAMLSACQDQAQPTQLARDVVADSFGLPAPAVSPVAALTGASPLHPAAQSRVAVLRGFFARDFALLDDTLSAAHLAYVQGRSERDEAGSLVAPILETKLAGIDICTDWLAAKPQSYIAHWVCAEIWQEGAWQARTNKFAKNVSREQFAVMNERLLRSNQLAQKALTLTDRPMQALGVLASNLHTLGQREQARDVESRARTLMPASPLAYFTAANFAMPRWGGSIDQVKLIIEEARKAGVHADALTYMFDRKLGEPWSTATPGAERAYWERAVAEHASYDRMKALFRHLVGLTSWRDALEVSDRIVAAYPQQAEPRYWRGRANEALGRMPEALAEYQLGAAMGHDSAIEHLIRAHLQGTLGLPPKDFAGLLEVCRYGAALGSGAAANCLGSGHWDGSLPPLARDPAQALAWHLHASRAGHFNSQHDLGWLLLSNRQPAGTAPQLAKSAGVFWLRRSAEQGHAFAPKKLSDAGIAVVEQDAWRPNGWIWAAQLVSAFVDFVLRR